MAEDPSGQRALLVSLVKANVRFVVIGGHAVAAHGYERATRVVDIVFAADRENCERFAAQLRHLDAAVRVADLPAPGGEITAEWLAGGGHFVFATAHGLLDALSWIAGFDHAALESRALTVELADDTELKVCSYEDLVAMKGLAARPRDHEDLRELDAPPRRPTTGTSAGGSGPSTAYELSARAWRVVGKASPLTEGAEPGRER